MCAGWGGVIGQAPPIRSTSPRLAPPSAPLAAAPPHLRRGGWWITPPEQPQTKIVPASRGTGFPRVSTAKRGDGREGGGSFASAAHSLSLHSLLSLLSLLSRILSLSPSPPFPHAPYLEPGARPAGPRSFAPPYASGVPARAGMKRESGALPAGGNSGAVPATVGGPPVQAATRPATPKRGKAGAEPGRARVGPVPRGGPQARRPARARLTPRPPGPGARTRPPRPPPGVSATRALLPSARVF